VAIPRRRADPGTGEDPTDRARTDPITEPDQFTLNPAMPPAWILPGQPYNKIPHLVADRRTTRPVRIRPLPGDQAAMPGQQRGGSDDPVLPQYAGQQPRQR
jgi:hypothetical protein